MKFGEILDQGFSLYRKNLWKLAGTTTLQALMVISIYVADLLWIHLALRIGHPADKTDNWGLSFLVWVIYSQIAAFIHPLFLPAVVKVTTGILFEEPVSVVGALRFTVKRWHSYLWIDLLKNGVQTLLPEALGLGVAFAIYFADQSLHFGLKEDAMGFIYIFVILAGAAFSYWIGACVAFAVPAAAVEGIKGFKAIRRSWRLSKGARFQIFVAWMMTFFLIMFLSIAIEWTIRSVESFLSGTLHLHFVNQRFYIVSYYTFAAIYNAAVGPIYPVLLVLIYLNQRVRKEGYDIERMIEVAGLTVPVAVASGEVTLEPAAVEAAPVQGEGADAQPAGESIA
jgi:hypothetical protein